MKDYKYQCIFKQGTSIEVYSSNLEDAIILAKAIMIRKGLAHEIDSVWMLTIDKIQVYPRRINNTLNNSSNDINNTILSDSKDTQANSSGGQNSKDSLNNSELMHIEAIKEEVRDYVAQLYKLVYEAGV